MKAIIWSIYISSIVILCVKAQVQDNDRTEICSKCSNASLPRCESTDDERLDKKVYCQPEGCVVALDTETNYICLLQLQSLESTIQQSENDMTATTVQPVPIALQMVPTTESSKKVSKENNKPTEFVEENDKTVEQLGSNAQNTEHNAALAAESDTEEKDKTMEQAEETQTVESEHHEEQAALASEGEGKVTFVQENAAESPETPEASNTAVADVSSTADEETFNTENSPDYVADEPANEDSASQLHEGQPEEENNAEQTEPENMSDTHAEEAAEENQKPEMNGETTAVTDNTVKDADSETQIQTNKAQGENVTSAAADRVTDVPSIAAATVTTDQFLSCHSCTSSTDTKCTQGPGRATNCPTMENKQNGCYTLYKADLNITTRGCITELTTEGLKYCKSHAKRCVLCYEKGCNNLQAPSAASRNIGILSFLLGIGSLVFIKIMIH